jgi:regulator of protease activity HflC (stomatin/prohibitin superfamily)
MIMDVVLGGAAVFMGISVLTAVRQLQEYERAVIFRLGRARKDLAHPGLNFLLPWGIDRLRVVDVRIKAIQIPPQEVITHDNISISVDAVVYAEVASPRHAVLEVEDFMPATLQLAATTLRAVLGKMDLDEILAHRDTINNEIRTILDTRTEQWGVEISAVEIKDIQLPKEMQRAMARQAEAEREKRAKIIHAAGELEASAKLSQAAGVIATEPMAITLRYLQTLTEIAAEKNSTIIFPLPIEIIHLLKQAAGTDRKM